MHTILQTTMFCKISKLQFPHAFNQVEWESSFPDVSPDDLSVLRYHFSETIHGESAADLLSPEETARAERFRFPDDKARYTAGRALLRYALAEQLGCQPQNLSLKAEKNGKPYLDNNTDNLHFNVAHTDDIYLIGCNYGNEIGVDVERIGRHKGKELERMFKFVSHPEEGEIWDAHREEERPLLFTRLWTMKEAILKAHGAGLTIAPRTINLGAALESGVGDIVIGESKYAFAGRQIDDTHCFAVAIWEENTPAAQ